MSFGMSGVGEREEAPNGGWCELESSEMHIPRAVIVSRIEDRGNAGGPEYRGTQGVKRGEVERGRKGRFLVAMASRCRCRPFFFFLRAFYIRKRITLSIRARKRNNARKTRGAGLILFAKF